MSIIKVSNIDNEIYDDGILLCTFDVHYVDADGKELIESTADWIDLNDGLLVEANSNASNMYHWNGDEFDSAEQEEIHGFVNDYLNENPIPESRLQAIRDAKAARDAEIFAM